MLHKVVEAPICFARYIKEALVHRTGDILDWTLGHTAASR